jgi:hypothetical protein
LIDAPVAVHVAAQASGIGAVCCDEKRGAE